MIDFCNVPEDIFQLKQDKNNKTICLVSSYFLLTR